jgi:hypothetical protein
VLASGTKFRYKIIVITKDTTENTPESPFTIVFPERRTTSAAMSGIKICNSKISI